jgi:Flp pilus assembly pilin Flp
LRSEEGPTATEYAVLIAVICIAALSSMAAFGDRVTAIYTMISDTVENA